MMILSILSVLLLFLLHYVLVAISAIHRYLAFQVDNYILDVPCFKIEDICLVMSCYCVVGHCTFNEFIQYLFYNIAMDIK